MATTSTAPASGDTPVAKPVTLITQTHVLPDRNDEFARWQQQISDVVSAFPGLVDHQIIPPSPPQQVDWVIVQKFASADAARAWLRSPDRLRLVEQVQPILVGHDDIHLIEEGDEGQGEPGSVSAVISVRVVPGQEVAYRAWGQKIAAAQAKYPGFQGFKVTPPIPGVQDDWVTVLQFDNEAHLNDWMSSPERQSLLDEAKTFTTESHYRTVRSGFEQWFQVGGAAHAPAWKQNMLVLLALYPVVFLFGYFVQTPILMRQLDWPFWLALFAGNVAGVIILNWLVPWVSKRFTWWLAPAGSDTVRRTAIGIVILIALYALFMAAFSRFP